MRRIGMLFCGLVFIGGIVFLALLAPSLFNPFGWGPGSYGWAPGPWGWGAFGFPVWALGMLVFCLVMMGGMMMHGVPHMHRARDGWVSQPRESLSDILTRRYSQGEITKDEFEEMKQALGVVVAGSANEHARH